MSIFALKCPIFVAGDALKGGFIRPHDLFHIINTQVKISQSKLETLLPLTWNQESFRGSTMNWYHQVLFQALLHTSDGDVPEMILMHLLEF